MSTGSDSPITRFGQMEMDSDLRNLGPRVAFKSENWWQKHMFHLISTCINVALFITVIVFVFTSNKGSPHDVNTILTTPQTPTTPRSKGVCLPGYDVWEGNCYKVYLTPFTYDSAEKTCENDGTHLVSIHSYEENEFVNDHYRAILNLSGLRVTNETYLGFLSIWLGLEFHFPTASYKWTDDTPYDYSYWRPNGNPVRDGYYWTAMESFYVTSGTSTVINYTQWNHNYANNSDRHVFLCKHPL